jgi:integrase/recombinase XerD
MTPAQFGTTLDLTIDQYLQRQRSLGRGYANEERVIDSLRRFIVHAGASDLDQEIFKEWCKSHEQLTANVRRQRQRIVRNFCLYRQRTEPNCFVPDRNNFPRPCPHALPVIFGPAEVARMLAVAKTLAPTAGSPLRAAVMRLAVVILYTAGLRRGELLRLTLADVDAQAGVLRIRESKFRKSRLVPLSRDAHRELRGYLRKRLAHPFSSSPISPLLCNCSRGLRGYTGTGLRDAIQSLFQAASVRSSDGRTPRVHDFRHSFAIQSLLRWYRQGADVQSNLPKLAMYMGHVSIVSTAYYLRWFPELAEVASQRFATRFGHLVTEGVA